ncbi:uncharacterized protein E5676_scaffold475G001120 [Cucumis melo var. makuwa]|uniref:Cotton fiber protein n=2 Tax=Cucumis melo TaxID=3656 RepID=A0A5A7SZQ9_CUCMM|nr:uncharacterized protein LOC127151424 [Cucumis melo]KAA0034569.1 uncharacterized protein E6C27_scaffold65G005850 [Cucumis melo var. makuwa]TYK09121.1 uncharacterized protein E5676_scaffold475G001120 [Cucumis melo var. makuwa]
MQSKRPPIFQKLSSFLKVSIFIAKMKRPLIPKLLFLKKSSGTKNFELLQHYNYGSFVRDFQFSPSTTPLFRFNNRGSRRGLRRYDVCSVLFPCRCIIGASGGEKKEKDGDYDVEEAFPESLDWSDNDDDSIDRRAEIFIQKFYADMKMERLASI